MAQAKKENINATTYTHPIGAHGHAAGPAIGKWDQQNGVPGKVLNTSAEDKPNYI